MCYQSWIKGGGYGRYNPGPQDEMSHNVLSRFFFIYKINKRFFKHL
jgi:hypothetical protein